jgi:hypothetical protein
MILTSRAFVLSSVLCSLVAAAHAAPRPAPALKPVSAMPSPPNLGVDSEVIQPSWKDLGTPFGKDAAVKELAVEGTTVYAIVSTPSSGAEQAETVYRSDDEGTTWAVALPARPAWDKKSLRGRIVVNGRAVLVRTKDGLMRSTNAGKTWTAAGSDRLIARLGAELISVSAEERQVASSKDGAKWKDKKLARTPIPRGLAAVGDAIFIAVTPQGDEQPWFRYDGTSWKSYLFTDKGADTFFDGGAILLTYKKAHSISLDGGLKWLRWSVGIEPPNSFAASSEGIFSNSFFTFAWAPPGRPMQRFHSPPEIKNPKEGCRELALTPQRLLTSCFITGAGEDAPALHVYAIELADLQNAPSPKSAKPAP